MAVETDSVEQCMAACAATLGCKYFVFDNVAGVANKGKYHLQVASTLSPARSRANTHRNAGVSVL